MNASCFETAYYSYCRLIATPPYSCVLQECEAVRTSQGRLPERGRISHRKQGVSLSCDLYRVDCRDIWLLFKFSLTRLLVCFTLLSKFLPQLFNAYQKDTTHICVANAIPHLHRAIEQAGMMMKVSSLLALAGSCCWRCNVILSLVLWSIYQEQKKMPEAIQYIEKACMMYMENGTPDTAAMALDRAGK